MPADIAIACVPNRHSHNYDYLQESVMQIRIHRRLRRRSRVCPLAPPPVLGDASQVHPRSLSAHRLATGAKSVIVASTITNYSWRHQPTSLIARVINSRSAVSRNIDPVSSGQMRGEYREQFAVNSPVTCRTNLAIVSPSRKRATLAVVSPSVKAEPRETK